ncbi:MAG: hypothetical protein EP306_09775 [Burkholderiales bacterium]|nr:MAG: hypothetical protein EP306_09775 [Burkholderiales bacterium]
MTGRTLAALLLCCMGAGAMPATMAWAQTGTSEAPVYEDRVIADLPPAQDDPPQEAYDASGPPRFLRTEVRLGTRPFVEDDNELRASFSAFGLVETRNHGSLSFDGTYSEDSRDGTLTLRQRGLPLAGGHTVNLEAGIIDQPLPSLNRLPSRVAVPSSTLRGVGAEWLSPAQGLQWVLSTGQPGRLESLPDGGFTGFSGQRHRLGVQWEQTDEGGFGVSLQHERGNRVTEGVVAPDGLPVDLSATLLTAKGALGAWVWSVHAMRGSTAPEDGRSHGWWAETSRESGLLRQTVGLYRLEPGLGWAGISMANNLQGGFWRGLWRTRQWSLDASLDLLEPVEGPGGTGYYGNLNGRLRLDRSNQVGGGLAIRDYRGQAWATYADWRRTHDLGTSGLRLELADAEGGRRDERRLAFDQEWNMPLGWALNTSLGAARARVETAGVDVREESWFAAASISAPLGRRASLQGSLGTEQVSGAPNRHNANLSAIWRLNPRWSLEAQYIRSTAGRVIPSLDPLAPPPEVLRVSSRSFFVVLRHELRAGSRPMPLGGSPEEGGGSVEGVVFFDANRNGTQEASEAGVPGVIVLLDNRWAVRTDAQGRFEFPFVASGIRTVTVRNDALPLPWSVAPDVDTKVDVRLRGTARISIPVQREN